MFHKFSSQGPGLRVLSLRRFWVMCPRFRVPGPDFRLYVIDINLFMRLILFIY